VQQFWLAKLLALPQVVDFSLTLALLEQLPNQHAGPVLPQVAHGTAEKRTARVQEKLSERSSVEWRLGSLLQLLGNHGPWPIEIDCVLWLLV